MYISDESSDLLVNTVEQVYYASEEFGVDDVHTSGGYYHMADVFERQDNAAVAQSLYRKVSQSLTAAHCSLGLYSSPRCSSL